MSDLWQVDRVGERSRREARANWRLSWVVRKLRQWPPVWLTPTPAAPYQARSTLFLTSEKSKDPSKDISLEHLSGWDSLESREQMFGTSGEEHSAGHSELSPEGWRGGVDCSCRRGGRDHLLTGQGGVRRLAGLCWSNIDYGGRCRGQMVANRLRQ